MTPRFPIFHDRSIGAPLTRISWHIVDYDLFDKSFFFSVPFRAVASYILLVIQYKNINLTKQFKSLEKNDN